MARGVKREIDELIASAKEKLEKKKAEVTAIQAQIKELEAQKQSELLSKVAEAAAAKGVTIEELLEKAIK